MKLSRGLSLLSLLPLTLAAPPSSASSGNSAFSGHISMGWFADWHDNFTVSNINWGGYNAMAFFTAQPDNNLNVFLEGTNVESMLNQFVSAARANNVKALLTIGGWTGSIYWSSSVATVQNRTTFANNVAQFARKHNLDGIDFDWEVPVGGGMPCNIVNSDDTANFLEFITELRQLVPDLILSAAVGVLLFLDATGHPISDASGFAKQLDWIEVMNYDIFDPLFATTTGPNAPLDDSCSPHPSGSAMSSVRAWIEVGFSPNQIVLGVPSYGHSFSVPRSTAVSSGNQLEIYTSFNRDNTPQGDAWDYVPSGSVDTCGQPEGPNGIFNFWAMVGYGYLNPDGSVASGMLSTFDQCSQTPFVYDTKTEVLISYDDPKSFTAKGQYISQAGLRGFAMFEVAGDYNGLLLNAINKAIS